uniref:Transcriptional activator protein n=1 Tax=Squash leaf curl virus TaxID=10829 RepID=A0A089PVI3_SLCV|nr:AC2 [Squash leaf curl virus]
MESRFKLKVESHQSCCAILERGPVIKISSTKTRTRHYESGLKKMPNSSSSKVPSIKAQHRIAKKRAVRRRRIDLDCGCSIYIHINCAKDGNGFTHMGRHHCASGREFRFYLGGSKSPLFQDVQRGGSTLHAHKDIPHSYPVQPQPEESTKSSQSVPELPSLDGIDSSFWDDIFE